MKGQSATATTPEEYIAELAEPRKAQIALLDQMIREEAPNLEPHIRSGMLAYGSYHYKYASGREGDWCQVALASNKAYISLYCCAVDERGWVAESYKEQLPKANIGKSCIRFKKVDDVDLDVLREIVRKTAASHFPM